MIVFACIHNAGRSQMAAAFYNQLTQSSRALSAGTRPGERVHPEVVTVMREKGVELSAVQPRLLTPELLAGAERLITMGCGEECPVAPGVPREDWPLEDPKGQPLEKVRAIRDDIERRVRALIGR